MPSTDVPLPASKPKLSVVDGERVVRATDVSLLIVTWNSEDWIGPCLDAVDAACRGLSYDVVVHDNASSDGTLSLLSRRSDDHVLVVDATENSGFAGGVNRAMGRGRGRYLLMLNPDCELAAGSVTTLVQYLDAHPDTAAAAPLLLDEDGRPQREFQLRRFPTLPSLAADLLLLDELLPSNHASSRYRYRELDISIDQPVEQPAGAALLLRRSVVDEVGPLDESFFPAWFEDVDYCRRISERGYDIRLVPGAKATHRGGASLEHVPFERFISIWYQNLFRYARKWMRPGSVELLRWLIITGALARGLAVLSGLVRSEDGRLAASAAYFSAAKEAFHRWDEASRSS